MTTQRLLAGASGYSFKEWKGTFYPEKIKAEDMLAFYADRLPTVEINNTFYQMPKVTVLENWAGGPVLFQLPPFMKKDLPRLTEFLDLLPDEHRAAFEFRNDSWFTDDVYAALKSTGAALCLSEREDNAPPPLVETAPWGYVRLRLETYSDADLEQWARRLEGTSWRDIYVYFMHEPTAPAYARALMQFGSS